MTARVARAHVKNRQQVHADEFGQRGNDAHAVQVQSIGGFHPFDKPLLRFQKQGQRGGGWTLEERAQRFRRGQANFRRRLHIPAIDASQQRQVKRPIAAQILDRKSVV